MSRSLKNEKANLKPLNFVLIVPAGHHPKNPGGWRAALAEGNGKFRKYGAYDHIPSGRLARRALARLTKNKRGAR